MHNYIKVRDELIKAIDELDPANIDLTDYDTRKIIKFTSLLMVMTEMSKSETPTAGMDAIANSLAYGIHEHHLLAYTDPGMFLSNIRDGLVLLNELENWGVWTDESPAPSTESLINKVLT